MVVTPEQCRIVKYDEYYDYIERSFDGEEVSDLTGMFTQPLLFENILG